MKETVTEGNCPIWLTESASLVGTKRVNALSGTGVASAWLVLDEAAPPPAPEVPVVEEVEEREVPAREVFRLEEIPALVLRLESTVWMAEEDDAEDRAEVGLTFWVARVRVEFWEESDEVDGAVGETPLVSEGLRIDVVVVADALPAPADDPWVLDGVAATVPVEVDCT